MTENLKFILGRYDHYIESVQSKSSLYITLNTFILTGFFTLFAGFSNRMNVFLIAFLIAIILISVISLVYTLIALIPRTKRTAQDSIIFFGDVADKNQPNQYYELIKDMDEETFTKNLAQQVQQVAQIVCKKHIHLKYTNQFLIAQICLITIWMAIFFLTIKL